MKSSHDTLVASVEALIPDLPDGAHGHFLDIGERHGKYLTTKREVAEEIVDQAECLDVCRITGYGRWGLNEQTRQKEWSRGPSEPPNAYTPWLIEGITELEYYKRAYLAMSAQVGEPSTAGSHAPTAVGLETRKALWREITNLSEQAEDMLASDEDSRAASLLMSIGELRHIARTLTSGGE